MSRTAFALVALLVVSAGCVSGPAGTPTATDTEPTPTATDTESTPSTDTRTTAPERTPPPNRTVEFPDGPKDRPERPDTLTAESVGQFAKTHEYRYAYNQLWYNEHSEVTLDCQVEHVTEHDGWFEAQVSCTGYSNTGGDESGTETATELHADWFTQTYTYLIDEDSLVRE